MKHSSRLKRSRQLKQSRQRGFTLMEVMVSMPIVVLLLLGTLDLFITALRTAGKTDAAIASSQGAANAVQHVVEVTREAQWFSLPGETAPDPGTGGGGLALGFVPQSGHTASDYQTTLAGETVFTGIELTVPTALLPSDVGYTDTSRTTITVLDKNGSLLPLPVGDVPYNRNATPAGMTLLLIYRANADGTPDAAAGSNLWEYSVQDNGASFNRSLCSNVSPSAANAVQFVRPYENGAALLFQVEIKIISSDYSAINGTQTNEETNGTQTSQLVGKCVLMRDHYSQGLAPSADAVGSARSVNDAFLAH